MAKTNTGFVDAGGLVDGALCGDNWRGRGGGGVGGGGGSYRVNIAWLTVGATLIDLYQDLALSAD